MTFVYTYRTKNGSIFEEVIEAPSRKDAFDVLHKRGISPLRVQERKEKRGISKKRRQNPWKLILYLTLFGIASGISLYVYFTRTADHGEANIQDTGKKHSYIQQVATSNKVVTASKSVRKTKVSYKDGLRQQIDLLRKQMAGNISPDSKDAINRKIADLEDLLANEKHLFNATNIPPHPKMTFKTSTEQLLDWVFNARIGDEPPPPIPDIADDDIENIEQILNSENVVDEDDSEDVAERKRMVDYAKKELKKYLDGGGDVKSFLQYYYSQLERYHTLYCDSVEQVEEVCRTESPELARKYLEAVNKKLEEQGIKPIELKKGFIKKLGLEDSYNKKGDQ